MGLEFKLYGVYGDLKILLINFNQSKFIIYEHQG